MALHYGWHAEQHRCHTPWTVQLPLNYIVLQSISVSALLLVLAEIQNILKYTAKDVWIAFAESAMRGCILKVGNFTTHDLH